MNLEELAAGMGPACGFLDVALGIQGIETGKGIGLQNPLEGGLAEFGKNRTLRFSGHP